MKGGRVRRNLLLLSNPASCDDILTRRASTMNNQSEQLAIQFLKEVGISVTKIPEEDEKRADLRASDGQCEYLVEVKEKLDTGSQLNIEREETEHGSVVIAREPLKSYSRLASIFKDGSRQLQATPKQNESFSVLWLHVQGMNADMLARRALYTFYGVANLSALRPDEGTVNCAYFDYSTASQMPNVDGLVIMEEMSLQICLNEFSPRYEAFKLSKLVTAFESASAVYDPSIFDGSDGRIALRSKVPRKDEAVVLEAVFQQTGIRYIRVNLNRHTFGAEK